MEKIKEKNIVVGDFIYIIEKDGKRRFILKILLKKEEGLKFRWGIYYWKLKNISKKMSIFNPIEHKDNYIMRKKDWEWYNLYKLNKGETEKFKRLRILEGLK